jgi:hypothetical protein
MSETTSLTKNRIISELSKSPHGSLKEYLPIGRQAAEQEPEFFAHLIAWDALRGQVRDAKVALPLVSLSVPSFPDTLAENSWAHLAKLNPRELLKALKFTREARLPRRMRRFKALVHLYLAQLESEGHFQRVALQHHKVLQELYRVTNCKPSDAADKVLFKNDYTNASLFQAVGLLKTMSASEAAGTILEKKIPFLVALGALGAKSKDPDIVLALINRMSPTELVTNTKMLERLGVKTNPSLKGAFESALSRASTSKANTLKTIRASEQFEDEGLKTKLQGLQEKQLKSIGVEGNWLVLADKSGSMDSAIEAAKMVASTLAKLVKGQVWLIFFDTTPQCIEVTGLSLDAIRHVTQYIRAAGGTSIGCGLQWMLEMKKEIDGIAIVSDGCENSAPEFWPVYKRYSDTFVKEVPVYLYKFTGTDYLTSYHNFVRGHELQEFDCTVGFDYYSLPNLVATMRTNRYSLADEIMSSKLLKLTDVFKTYKLGDMAYLTQKEVSKNASA